MGQEGSPRRAGRGIEKKSFARSGRYGANNFSMAMEPMQKHSTDDGAIGIEDLAWWPSDCDAVDSCQPRRRLLR